MKYLHFLWLNILMLGVVSLFAHPIQASCGIKVIGNVPVSPTPGSLYGVICSIDVGTVEGADIAANETSSTNTAIITLENSSITINASGATLAAGSVVASGTSSSLAVAGGSYLGGNGLWIADGDADGWALTNFTLYSATASGRRRLGLMRSVSTADCNDAAGNYNINNACNYGDGADGAVTISADKNINTDTIAAGRSYADGIAYRVTAPSDSATSVTRYIFGETLSNGIAAGDDVLLINLQGTTTDFADVGNYEIMTVSAVSASTITFTTAITKSFDGTAAANQSIVIQRIPNYTDVTVNAGINLTASPWDGLTTLPFTSAGYYTGIVALRANGTVTINGTIHANSLGYRGGYADNAYGLGGEAYCGLGGQTEAASGAAGAGRTTSGVGGTGFCGGGAGSKTNATAGSGSATQGGSGGGGSGGAGGRGGGAGGGYGTIGYRGMDESGAYTAQNGGTNASGNGGYGSGQIGGGGGGGTYGSAALTTLFLGSGGGQGGGITIYTGGSGGDGGGIVYIAAATVSFGASGMIKSTGENGLQGDSTTAGGGGGAGGSIYVISDNTVSTGNVDVSGGAGCTAPTIDGGSGGSGRYYLTH